LRSCLFSPKTAFLSASATYRTVKTAGESLYKEKGSKFFGFAVACASETEAKELLARWRKDHPQAVHVCYAFRFGSDKKHFRASDDGEPSNSAGPPILGQIQSFDVTNTLVAVVRYYGGTNLGVGGLIAAYRTAAKEALENAEIAEEEDKLRLTLEFGYDLMPAVMSAIKMHQITVLEQQLELQCRIVVEIAVSNEAAAERLGSINGLIINKDGIEE
jgi:uncharacterized YigZ family protein